MLTLLASVMWDVKQVWLSVCVRVCACVFLRGNLLQTR